MPSIDHGVNKSSEMTTLTNSLEVFDTYKHREDKDSDEESFHLPLDDDESESKYQESVKNGNGNETEDEILNKFDSTTTAFEPIDSQLEESLLNEEEEEEKGCVKVNGIDKSSEIKSNSSQLGSAKCDNVVDSKSQNENINCDVKDNKNACTEKDNISAKGIAESKDCSTEASDNIEQLKEKSSTNEKDEIVAKDTVIDGNHSIKKNNTNIHNNATKESAAVVEDAKTAKINTVVNIDSSVVKGDEVPKVDIDTNTDSSKTCEESSAIDKSKTSTDKIKDECSLENSKSKENEDLLSEIDNVMEAINEKEFNANEKQFDKVSQNDCGVKEDLASSHADDKYEGDKEVDKCEYSNDSSKNQIEDSEDLFDISIIRDAEEDNAESAYNEAHPEESHIDENEEYDDRNDDKVEDECNSDKATNLEEDEEEEDIDIDKHEDQLKSDDVDIEETSLKLDCDVIKDTVSDGESDSNNRTDLVKINKEQVQDTNETSNSVKEGARECRLDEVTGNLIGADGMQSTFTDRDKANESMDIDGQDSDKRKSLKRAIVEDGGCKMVKKPRTESTADVEIKEVEKPKEKLPLRTLLSLSDFMKSKKTNKRLTTHDLEEFCLQKICEVIVHKSDLGDMLHQLKIQEQLIETMRREIQQLTKQARDLEIVNKKLMNDLKQQNATQKPLNPLKITRSVGLQVKFTPAFEANMKRRQPNAAITAQKVQIQTANRGPRNIPNTITPGINRQLISSQKQQQPLPKPNTPLLSQALQNRRVVINDATNKNISQAIRTKAPDPKSGGPSASVIDLTDEDDKKDKNKNAPPKVVTQKNITVPLRTTPMRVNATQGIRLTTSQGKVSPITSVVTSSAPQVMYVVQSTPQNVLTSALGPKAVVVNFQSANGVLTSALNGSSVSVIPKQSNTIQLKTVTPTKTLTNNKIIKIPHKHPAPLPPPPVIRVSLDKPLKPIPPKPHLTIRKTDTGIILQWKMPYELDMYEIIASYQLYAYQETSALPSTDMWRKVGDVKALALPMACTLTQFADKNKYYFAVRPVDIYKRIGLFSEPEEISL